MLFWDAAAGRPAYLSGFILSSSRYAAADTIYDVPEGHAYGHLHKACVIYISGQGKDLCALAFFRTEACIPLAAFKNNRRDVRQGLHIVYDGWLSQQALLERERGLLSWLAPASLNGGHKSGFLTADKGACANSDLDVEVKAA